VKTVERSAGTAVHELPAQPPRVACVGFTVGAPGFKYGAVCERSEHDFVEQFICISQNLI
jgi:hypothetical protein